MFSYNDGFRQEDIDININNDNINTNMNDNMNFNNNMNMGGFQQPIGDMMSPVIEPGRERVVNRTFVHEVPQECQFMIEKIL